MKDFKVSLGPGVTMRGQDFMQDKLLLVATSRYGKSRQCRNIAEQIGKLMPIFVVDHEGEFKSLRTHLPIVIAGPDGEVPARPETAAKLARRLVEARTSAVLDISEMTLVEKRLFVRNFLTALNELPRVLWGPRLVILDEIQEFCPQVGDADGAREVVNRFTAICGKRGIGVVAASQRIAKVHKDSVSVFQNVCVGRFTLDADVKRARDLLSFGAERASEIRNLQRGQFFALGPSFEHDGIQIFRGGDTKTHHPSSVAEKHTLKPPPPSRAILKFAAELQDLQKEADEEKSEIQRLRDRVQQLEKEAKARPRAAPPSAANGRAPTPQPVSTKILENQLAHARQVANLQGRQETLAEFGDDVERLRLKVTKLSEIRSASDELLDDLLRDARQIGVRIDKSRTKAGVDLERTAKRTPAPTSTRPAKATASTSVHVIDPNVGSSSERRILIALAQHPDGLDRKALAILAGVSPTSGGYAGSLAKFRSEGLITRSSPIQITPVGRERLGNFEPLPEGPELVQYWLQWLATGESRVLDAAIQAGQRGLSREELAIAAGMTTTSGGYAGILAKLRRLELLTRETPIRAATVLLEAARA